MRRKPNFRISDVIRKVIVLVGLWALAVSANAGPAAAQTDSPTSNSNQATPAPTATPTPIPIPVSALISEAEAVSTRLREIGTGLEITPDVAEAESRLPDIRARVDELRSGTQATLTGNRTLEDLRAVEKDWQSVARELSSLKQTLQDRLAGIDEYDVELNALGDTWKRTLAGLRGTADEANIDLADTPAHPPEVVQRIDQVLAAIGATRRSLELRRSALLGLQSRTTELEAGVGERLAEIRTARDRALTNIFVRDETPIWNTLSEGISAGELWGRSADSVRAQAVILRAYFSGRTGRFASHGLIFLLVTAALYWARSRVRPYVETEEKLERAAQIFEIPIVTGLIVSIVLSGWIYPEAPRVLTALLGIAVLVPVVILLRRLVEAPLFPILNALVILYLIDRLRELLAGQPHAVRILFLAEMAGAFLFLLWFLRTKRLAKKIEARHFGVFAAIRRIVPVALWVFAFAFAANAIGFVALAGLVGNGLLGSAYAALVLYTAFRIVNSLIVFALRVPPLASLAFVRNNRPVVREKAVRSVKYAALIVWALIALNLFAVRDAIFTYLRGMLDWSLDVGSIHISVGDVTFFGIVIWAAVLISRFLRFILEEDVFPRVELGGGVSYAVSTMLHYALIVGGFLFAVAALGVDFTKFAIIAGAVGIGVGFGLQNIINNFVSGLILLFERPVKVEDTVQIGENIGTLKQIGLRASVLRKVDGSDVIVPNSQLISEEVTNWTMSDKNRRIDIPLGVAYGTDPNQVIDIITEAAVNNPEILAEPAPQTLFLAFGDNSLNFELRAWTDNTDRWVRLRSELVCDIYDALNKANIEIPFPQRDLHLRSVDDDAARRITRDTRS